MGTDLLNRMMTKRFTMYDFHDSTDIFVNPSFLPFCVPKRHPELVALKTGILVPKVAYDLPKFKISP